MTDDGESILSDLLIRWHRWQQAYCYAAGFRGLSPGLEDWRASRQYDFENGAIDAAVDLAIMQAVDFEALQLPEPGRTAIHVNARSLSLGLSVFRSPRLPEDQLACLEIIAGARTELRRRLSARGVI